MPFTFEGYRNTNFSAGGIQAKLHPFTNHTQTYQITGPSETIIISDGADSNVLAGDIDISDGTDDIPYDATQYVIGGSVIAPGARFISMEAIATLQGSDGNTYTAIMFDFDINFSGAINQSNSYNAQTETSFFMAFIPNGFDPSDGISMSEIGQNGLPPGTIPPIGVTLSSPVTVFNGTHMTVCFTRGTLIKTPEGEIPIESLSVGDLVTTMDDGYEAIRWIGSTKRDAIDFTINPKLRPVRIPAGAFGSGLPHQDLLVSRQHRILVRSKVADRVFKAPEILVPAVHLVGFNGIHEACDVEQVEYFHFLFDKHEIVWANGSPAESLFTGPEALKALGPEARDEITELFPQIIADDYEPVPARFIPKKGKDIKKLLERHAKNDRFLYTA